MRLPRAAEYRKAARALHEREGAIEIDHTGRVAFGDKGAWVRADVWVPIETARTYAPPQPPRPPRPWWLRWIPGG